GPATIRFCSFASNGSPGDGGAIYAFGDFTTRTTISESFFSLNTAHGKGGAIVCQDCSVSANTFDSNSADKGGAFWGGATFLTNDTFYGNSASTGGGAIYSDGENLFNNLTIVQNSSADSAGGISITNDNADEIQNSIVALNTASISGPDCATRPHS